MSDANTAQSTLPDIVVVGGGLCGLYLASNLHAQGYSVALYEARDRLGGRILSVPCHSARSMVDLGPTWFWPNNQPRIRRLIAELGLQCFPQHDEGSVLQLTDHEQQPQTIHVTDLHGGAQRLAGGMSALIDALALRLPSDSIHLNQELIAVHERGAQVELLFRCANITTTVTASQVILAIPPRLIEEHVQFDPPLDDSLRTAMRATHTWMADQAKVVIGYETPFWRTAGLSGNAFVSHAHVTLGEIFDACDSSGQHAALGAFFALSPAFRASIDPIVIPMLISSQLAQVFGKSAEDGEQILRDWSKERFTCSTLDQTPIGAHPQYGNPSLQRSLWNGKVFLGASETATNGGGYLEGALDAAARIQRALATTITTNSAALVGINVSSLARFSATVAALRSGALNRYRQHLHRRLAVQQATQLTQHALLDTINHVYRAALDELATLPFDTTGVAIHRGRSDLTPTLLAVFDGFNAALLDEVVVFNRTSCAISNFPQDYELDADYVHTIKRDLVPAWREFALNVNDLLLEKAKH